MSAAFDDLLEFCEDDRTRNMLDDLQLAAELGKTLLERNKELESALRQYQNVIDDQTQEIEYLTKQTAALREVNKSRIQIYEKLEVSIQDLERENHRLVLENADQKKRIKSLTATVEGLETKCEELQTTVDDLRLQLELVKRRANRAPDPQTPNSSGPITVTLRHVPTPEAGGDGGAATPPSAPPRQSPGTPLQGVWSKAASPKDAAQRTPTEANDENDATISSTTCEDEAEGAEQLDPGMEQISQLLGQLREGRIQISRDERRIQELEEQLVTMVQQNQALENQVMQLHRNEESKSMHYELSHLDEVRQGQMCSRCLRNVDQSNSSDIVDEDDSSLLGDLMNTTNPNQHTSFSMEVQDARENPYKELVEKYEALLKVHCPQQNLSLQDELRMTDDFNKTKDTDEESGRGDSLKPEKQHKKMRKTVSRTPTDFSEAETSSSGFSDETSNKATQTEGRPGAFLCTIADGDDCKFSIYDDATSIDSRFRNKPEYQRLFKEIFSVLKKAAESKEEGEQLPLLEDHTPLQSTPKVPPVTPSNDHLPEFPDDDTQSIQSSTMSELSVSQAEPTTVIEDIIQAQNQPIPESDAQSGKEEPVLRPLVRQPLEYVSVEVRKRNSSRKRNKFSDRSDSPVTHIIGSPKISYSSRPMSGRKRREMRNASSVEQEQQLVWTGNSMQFWSSATAAAGGRSAPSPTPSQGSSKGCFEYRPSSASQDLHKLKKLDLSYAEVLRNADTKKRQHMAKQRRK